MRSHYTVLGIATEASPIDLRNRYRTLKALYEDDLGTYGLLDGDTREGELVAVEQAFAVLGDRERRQAYDASLKEAGADGPWYDWSAEEVGREPATAPVSERLAPEVNVNDLDLSQVHDGLFLATVRRARGLSLADVSDVLKISASRLSHIEDHDYHRLPAAVYLRGFLGNYARCLGLDARRVVADYMAKAEADGFVAK